MSQRNTTRHRVFNKQQLSLNKDDQRLANTFTSTNETIYRRAWEVIVDNAIARWATSSTSESATQKEITGRTVDVRDLMQLEEVLSRLESKYLPRQSEDFKGQEGLHAKGEHELFAKRTSDAGDNTARHKGRERKPLATITSLHVNNRESTATRASHELDSPAQLKREHNGCESPLKLLKSSMMHSQLSLTSETTCDDFQRASSDCTGATHLKHLSSSQGVIRSDGSGIHRRKLIDSAETPKLDLARGKYDKFSVLPQHSIADHEPWVKSEDGTRQAMEHNQASAITGGMPSRERPGVDEARRVASVVNNENLGKKEQKSNKEESNKEKPNEQNPNKERGSTSMNVGGKFLATTNEGRASTLVLPEVSVNIRSSRPSQNMYTSDSDELQGGRQKLREGVEVTAESSCISTLEVNIVADETSEAFVAQLPISPGEVEDSGDPHRCTSSPETCFRRDSPCITVRETAKTRDISASGDSSPEVRWMGKKQVTSADNHVVPVPVEGKYLETTLIESNRRTENGGEISLVLGSEQELPLSLPADMSGEVILGVTILDGSIDASPSIERDHPVQNEEEHRIDFDDFLNKTGDPSHISDNSHVESDPLSVYVEGMSQGEARRASVIATDVLADEEVHKEWCTGDNMTDGASVNLDITRIDPDDESDCIGGSETGIDLEETAIRCSSVSASSIERRLESDTPLDSMHGGPHDDCDECEHSDGSDVESPEIVRSSLNRHSSASSSRTTGIRFMVQSVDTGTISGLGSTCEIPRATRDVGGASEMDEGFGSSALSPGLVGFDLDGASAPSPVCLSDPVFAEEQSLDGDGWHSPFAEGCLSPAGSDSTLDAVPGSPGSCCDISKLDLQSPRDGETTPLQTHGGGNRSPDTSLPRSSSDAIEVPGSMQSPAVDRGSMDLPTLSSQGLPDVAQQPYYIMPLETERTDPHEKSGATDCVSSAMDNVVDSVKRGMDQQVCSKNYEISNSTRSYCGGSRQIVTPSLNGERLAGGENMSSLDSPSSVMATPARGKNQRSHRQERDSDEISITSFPDSASESDEDRLALCDGDDIDERWCSLADTSLVEGTPRPGHGIGSGNEDLSGFYAPLSMTYRIKSCKDETLSTEQCTTLLWMCWCENRASAGDDEDGLSETDSRLRDTPAVVFNKNNVWNGGILGHLSSEDAMECFVALIQRDMNGGPGDRLGRPGFLEPSTGLPKGGMLVVCRTKDTVREWSNRLTTCAAGLSVLEYVMPLRERRRLDARQVATFDAVVTTYDVLKAKEVPQSEASKDGDVQKCVSFRKRNENEWLSRQTGKEAAKSRCDSNKPKMMSLLHKVWWRRVVADNADILATGRSARMGALLGLAGLARWCIMNREGMEFMERTGDRMRSLTDFLRVPAELPLVEAAPYVFFDHRPQNLEALPTSKNMICSSQREPVSCIDKGDPTKSSTQRNGTRKLGVLSSSHGTREHGHWSTVLLKPGSRHSGPSGHRSMAIAVPSGTRSTARAQILSDEDGIEETKSRHIYREDVAYTKTHLCFKTVHRK